MPNNSPPNNTIVDVSEDTLAEVPARALKFLMAAADTAAIRAALATRGYSKDDHQLGWQRLHGVAGYSHELPTTEPTSDAALALKKIDSWDEEGFALIEASWQYQFPAQYAFVTAGGLHAERGRASIQSVKTLLDRLDALESSPERAATREQDHAALALLAKRSLDAARRAQLRALLEQAQSFEPVAPAVDNTASKADDRQKRVALYIWLSEWSQIARTAIKRRDHLIRLGLAKPRKGKKDQPEG